MVMSLFIRSTVDESSLTGESRPVKKSPGESVSGGTINTGNMQLVVKTTATSNNSAVARLIRLVEEAQSKRSETEKMVDSFAAVYTPIVVLVTLYMCTMRINHYDNLPEHMNVMTNKWSKSGGTTGFISIEGEGIVGAYSVADRIREEAKDVVAALKKMGIEITMLTGDQRPAALGIGGQIGLEEQDVRSGLLPEDKMGEIGGKVTQYEMNKKIWKARRTAMMVGDGVNDAPALALAVS